MIEKIVVSILERIMNERTLSDDEYIVYNYGLTSGVEILIWYLMCIATALFLQMIPETIAFLLIFTTTRSLIGGIHLKRYGTCVILSYFTFLLVVFLVDRIEISSLQTTYYITIALIIVIRQSCNIECKHHMRIGDSSPKNFLKTVLCLDVWEIIVTFLFLTKSIIILKTILWTMVIVCISKYIEKAKNHFCN